MRGPTAHDWVKSKKEQFESRRKYLADNQLTVIAMRDLAKCVDPAVNLSDLDGAIEIRKKRIESKRDGNHARPVKNDCRASPPGARARC